MRHHQNYAQHQQQKDGQDHVAVVLHKLAHAGQGVDVPFQHIVADRPGVDGENGLVQDTGQLGIAGPHGHGNAVLLVQHPLDFQIVVPHFRTELIFRQIAVAQNRVRLAILDRVHALLLGVENQKVRIVHAHHVMDLVV